MSSKEIVTAVSEPEFYIRVCFLALKAAQNVAAEKDVATTHKARLSYARRVIQGADNAILLAMHVASSSPKISKALENGGEVSDKDIEAALVAIWDARSAAYSEPLNPAAIMEMPPAPDLPKFVGEGYPPNV